MVDGGIKAKDRTECYLIISNENFINMRYRLIYLLFLIPTCMFGQKAGSKAETLAYIEKFYKIAIREMYEYRIPASITLAQGILESGSGQSDLAQIANNHFGIKCTSDYVGDTFLKDDDKKDDCFRVYLDAESSYRDHSLFLVNRSRYSFLFTYWIRDYKAWAIGLKKAGYATNPNYPKLLIDVIEQYELYEYDRHPERYVLKSSTFVSPIDVVKNAFQNNTTVDNNDEK